MPHLVSLLSPGPAQRTGGFTLTDLLASLAALSLLAAIVLPVSARLRGQTRLAGCVANLQQINRAVLLYAEDHQKRLPLLESSPAPGGWWWYKEQVKSHVGLTGPSSAKDKIFACPDDRGYGVPGQEQPFCRSAKYDYTSYVFNGVNLPGIPNVAGWEIENVRDPGHTLSVMEWTAHGPLSWHRSKTGRANAPFYNDAESVVGFVDGRVALIPIYYDGINPAFTRDPIGGYAYKYGGD